MARVQYRRGRERSGLSRPHAFQLRYDGYLRGAGPALSLAQTSTVIQLAVSQCLEKCRVINEPVTYTSPDNLRFQLSLWESRNQDVKAVSTPAALVMHDVMLIIRRCPNQTCPRKRGIR